jgi:hypothetical protein
MSCQNNLKQVALASHNYESANGCLPPGLEENPATPGAGSNSLLGTLSYMLPYVEQQNAYKLFPPAMFQQTYVGPWWGSIALGANAPGITGGRTRIKTFLCPSDNGQFVQAYGVFIGLTIDGSTLFGYYNANGGNAAGGGTSPGPAGRSNYIGCAGMFGNSYVYSGIYYLNSKTKQVDIQDGTSNTIAFGETLGGSYPPGTGANGPPRDYSLTWAGAGALPLYWGLPDPPQWYTFGSYHTGIVQFAFGDGSVRPIRKNIARSPGDFSQTGVGPADWVALMSVGGRSDGLVTNWGPLGGQ